MTNETHRSKFLIPAYFFFLVITGFEIGCGTTQHSKNTSDQHLGIESTKTASTLAHSELLGSSIDIQYILGHDHYRFFAAAQGSSIVGNTSLNKQILEQGTIDQNRYPEYFKKVSNFIHEIKRIPGDSMDSCRAPFTIVVKMGKQMETAHGCRATDGGALSRLVRDGEYLLYSKN